MFLQNIKVKRENKIRRLRTKNKKRGIEQTWQQYKSGAMHLNYLKVQLIVSEQPPRDRYETPAATPDTCS